MPIVEEVPHRLETIIIIDVQTIAGIHPVTLVAGDGWSMTDRELVITYKDRPDKELRFERRNILWWARATETRRVPITDSRSTQMPGTTSPEDPQTMIQSESPASRARRRRGK